MLNKGGSMNERQLHQLDLNLLKAVSDFRKSDRRETESVKSYKSSSSQASRRSQADTKSVRSQVSRTASNKPSPKESSDAEDLKYILGDGRHLGMSEEEWNRIVQKNVNDDYVDHQKRQQKLQD